MSTDLEETLNELGPAYRAVVDRLRAAPTREPRAPVQPAVRRFSFLRWGLPLATAAAAAFALFAPRVTVKTPQESGGGTPTPIMRSVAVGTPYTRALTASPADLAEILRTQAPDGSWSSDELTRQNAAALRLADGTSVAYRRALRYLRSKGLAPLTDDELRRRGRQVALRG